MTRGRPESGQGYRALYRQTLRNYRAEFNV